MSAAFIKKLDDEAKLWAAYAIAGLIVADGKVTDAETELLRDSIGFLSDPDDIGNIINMVKDRIQPELGALKRNRSVSGQLLMSLAMVAITDDTITSAEVNYFVKIGAKLGFDSGYAKLVINWGKEFIKLNQQKKKLDSFRFGFKTNV